MSSIDLTISGGVAVITLNRADKLNALTGAMLFELKTALQSVARDDTVRVLKITGAGRAFCAGGDVQDGHRFHNCSIEEAVARLRGDAECVNILHQLRVPTVAVVRGAVAGAGLGLALSCDLRIGSDTTKFVPAYVKLSLSGDFGGSYFLSQIVGPAKAKEIYFLGKTIDAPEALALGLLNRLTSDDGLEAMADDIVRRLGEGPTVALSYMKKNFDTAQTGTLAQVLDVEARNHIACHSTEDYANAVKAFGEKRAPEFKGR